RTSSVQAAPRKGVSRPGASAGHLLGWRPRNGVSRPADSVGHLLCWRPRKGVSRTGRPVPNIAWAGRQPRKGVSRPGGQCRTSPGLAGSCGKASPGREASAERLLDRRP
ncbi:MAG: hypothetical protein LBT40_13160, partial [Deltaproteobacteria bacterium]|nr:hypothetical protein [Deltaproteobacteria bacterium]